ncbi:MAG: hypothetical protein IKW90_17325 [Lachnospiraceae bacterium]|nr:hypothetical protein [Lachnospiraceae bacterium]
MTEIYYEDQTGWSNEDYLYLHRYLHRWFFYYKKYEDIILSIDLNRVSKETKVLIYCIIKYYHYEFMFTKYKNLQSLENTEPLTEKLILDDRTKQADDIYKVMNVVY